jgi:hypothetical protein
MISGHHQKDIQSRRPVGWIGNRVIPVGQLSTGLEQGKTLLPGPDPKHINSSLFLNFPADHCTTGHGRQGMEKEIEGLLHLRDSLELIWGHISKVGQQINVLVNAKCIDTPLGVWNDKLSELMEQEHMITWQLAAKEDKLLSKSLDQNQWETMLWSKLYMQIIQLHAMQTQLQDAFHAWKHSYMQNIGHIHLHLGKSSAFEWDVFIYTFWKDHQVQCATQTDKKIKPHIYWLCWKFNECVKRVLHNWDEAPGHWKKLIPVPSEGMLNLEPDHPIHQHFGPIDGLNGSVSIPLHWQMDEVFFVAASAMHTLKGAQQELKVIVL